MDRYPASDERLDLEPDGLVDLMPSENDRMPTIGRPRLRAVSVPSAVAGALLITTIALGAAGIRPASFDKDEAGDGPTTAVVETRVDGGDDAKDGTADDAKSGLDEAEGQAWKDDWRSGDGAKDEHGEAPKDEPKPEPKSEPTPAPKPTVQELGLTLAKGDGKVKVDWTTCKAEDFLYYKVLRSNDSTVSWPAGDNDKVIAAIESRSKTAMVDTSFPHGKKVWYRVFCIGEQDGDKRVLGKTAAKSIVTPADDPAPKPEPTLMGFEVDVTADGVVLHWEACGSDGFRYYKVVRSKGENPSYLPWTDGSEVIAVIEGKDVTTFVDTDVEPGDHWFYRVQSIGVWDGHKVLLGQTKVHDATID
jgi:hypothetical protein